MNKLIIAVALSMIAGQVFATGKDHHGNHGNHGNNGQKNGGSTANSSSASGAFSAAGAVAGSASISGATGGVSNASGGQGGAGGNAAGGTAVASIGAMSFNFITPPWSTGPSTSTSFVQHDYSGMPNNTPAMGNSYISTSNSCDGAVGASLVLPGFGGSVSAATLRMMCEGRLNSQAHKALGQEDKARLTMEVVQEYACEEDAKWAKIARKKGLCAPADEAAAVAQTNPAFNSK